MLNEADFLLGSAPKEEIRRQREGAGMSERIREWLATDEGTLAHHPAWGSNLGQFKFEPLSKESGIDVVIMLAITRKLPQDIEGVIVTGIDVQILDVDLCKVVIQHNFGRTEQVIQL